MSTKLKIAGTAAALAAALGGFVLISAGESAPFAAAPAALAHSAPTAPVDAKPQNQAAGADCGKQAWPYVAPECLAATSGTQVRKAIRTIEVSAR